MKRIKKILWSVWRVWFYIVMLIPILIMLPFLVASILTESGYPYFFKMSRIWAKCVLFGMGFYYKVEKVQKLDPKKSYMFVANHTSMTDIMLMLAVVDNPFVFVGKMSLAKIPLFGFFYKRTSILVDRSCSKSRMEVFDQAQKRINRGLSICIFPEGGVPHDESILLDAFKDGAFRLAADHHLPIVPLIFPDNKKRLSYTFYSGSPGLMRAKILSPVETVSVAGEPLDRKELREKVRKIILDELMAFKEKDASKFE
ncbi:lysophospholipid acyltransferase family protein [Flavobacterium aquicola]|uniref:1-acyl-sn-glycerol-3-phosphate acyltransferase n=1 Tax=Flavobacterium aquicola TaxID=1682742 RepID=A0A3E0EMC1_9FLAO|nr:lysophospholipid acyltransferase family protein [Flavobacterium aquicola]REG98853.1 1-acyl-sn-glycerol-3-phosphate acyltransferase [Flavobacterium aquicola]